MDVLERTGSGDSIRREVVLSTRQGLTSVVITTLLILMVLWGVPSAPHHALSQQYLDTWVTPLGLQQKWSMFAPNPSSGTLEMFVVVTFSDDSTATWTPPVSPGLGGASEERWRKWVERSASFSDMELDQDIREGLTAAAPWIAAQVSHSAPAQNIEYVSRWLPTRERGEPSYEWQERSILSVDLSELSHGSH